MKKTSAILFLATLMMISPAMAKKKKAKLPPVPVTENTNVLMTGDWEGPNDSSLEIIQDEKTKAFTIVGHAEAASMSGTPNVGDIEGSLQMGKGTFKFADKECKVSGELKDFKLIVKDNGHCGGPNVTFSGKYTR